MTQNHIYPSQERYDGKNPVVSFRLTNEDKKKLEEMASREDMTVGQYVRDFLKGIVEKRETEAKIYKKGRKEGFKEGYKEGMTGQFGSNVANVASRVILNLEMRRHVRRFQQRLLHGDISPVLRKKEPVIFSFQSGSLNFYW